MKASFTNGITEAGCDEAGRGCLAGPVIAAAVILPPGFYDPDLRDSKKCSVKLRYKLRERILNNAVAWAVARVDHTEIDHINILQASILAMHKALDQLPTKPDLVLVDGNRFKPWNNVPYQCIIRGDDTFFSIAAASILAKTTRDDYMISLHEEFPQYGWDRNKGYPTREHRLSIRRNGISPHHRRTFLDEEQLNLPFANL